MNQDFMFREMWNVSMVGGFGGTIKGLANRDGDEINFLPLPAEGEHTNWMKIRRGSIAFDSFSKQIDLQKSRRDALLEASRSGIYTTLLDGAL